MESRTPPRTVGPAPAAPGEVYAARRGQLLERLGDGVAVVPAAPELLKSRDTEIVYRQASDFYYLTGFDEPESVAVVSPHGPDRFTLFLRPRDPDQEVWVGPRIGIEHAAAELGADAVHPIDELEERLPDLLRAAECIHYPVGSGDEIEDLALAALLRARRQRQRTGTGPTGIADLEATTGDMRLVKDDLEIERIRTAAGIAALGHVAAMERTRPGVGEWEIQAALEARFLSIGAAAPAFPSIVAAGSNATTLHYVANRSLVRDGDLVLIDAGAEWGMYNSDITRTFPASGTFTPTQRALYDVVLAAEEAAIAAIRIGEPVTSPHEAAVRVLARGMLDLGILPPASLDEVLEKGAFRRFYMHQTSHWLGLDVHDAGPYRRAGSPVTIEPGMVMTIEPGIYIPADADDVPKAFRGVGIRIEDDVVVTTDGAEVITRGVPVAPEEIEMIMGG